MKLLSRFLPPSGIIPLAFMLVPLAALSDCATPAPKGPPPCAAADTDLRSAEAWFDAPERAALTGAFYDASLQPVSSISTARRVQQDLDTVMAALDRLDSGYGGVEACHVSVLRDLRSRQAAGSLSARAARDAIADERKTLDEARTGTRVALAHASAVSAIYSAAAETLAQAHPAAQIAVERANAQPHPSVGYKVTERATIYVAPNVHSGTIAAIRKGQRVSGPPSASQPGWVTIELNDGSIGYVMADVLRPVPLNPSALYRTHGHHTEISNDPLVVALLTARRTLPEKSQALEARLDSGRDQETQALQPAAIAKGMPAQTSAR